MTVSYQGRAARSNAPVRSRHRVDCDELRWETAFLTMAGVAGLTLLTAVVYWLLEEFRPHSTQASA